MNKRTVKEAFKSAIPVMGGYILLGIGFGVLLHSKGLGAIWALVMSIVIYSGTMQYIGVDVLATGTSVVGTAIMTLMVNIRYMFYSIAMLDKYKDSGKYKPYTIFGLTDETYSVLCMGNPKDTDEKKYYFFVTLFDQLAWIVGCVGGNIFSSVVNFNSEGIDFSMTALFIAVFIDQWRDGKCRKGQLIGLGVSTLCLVIFGADKFLIPAMLVITACLTVLIKGAEKRKNG